MTLQLESEKAVNERLVSAVQVSAPIHTQQLLQSDVRRCTCSILLQYPSQFCALMACNCRQGQSTDVCPT